MSPRVRTASRSAPSSIGSAPSAFEAEVKDLTLPIEFNLENMNHFIDFNREVPFQVQRGEGECAV